MRRYRIFLLMFLLIGLLSVGYGEGRGQDRLHSFTMENGLKVILAENQNAPVVALQVWVRVGSADETDEEAGMCHFIEHMIFKGTEKRGVGEMAREVESLGGSINAYTSYDHTVYHITIASRYADLALDILADAIQHSVFNPAEFEKEREVILEEIRMGEDTPSRKLFRQTMATVFKQHPYKRPIIGYEKSIRAMTREQMVAFFKRWYTPDRIFLVVAGDFSLQEMEAKARALLNPFERPSESLRDRGKEPEQKEPRSQITLGDFKETYFQMAIPIVPFAHEDTPGLDTLAQILGGGETSRLVQKVKLEKGLVHTISAYAYTPKDPGVLMVDATLPAENVERAVTEILKEIQRLVDEGVTAEELHRVRVNLESDFIYNRQTVQGQARNIGYYEAATGDIHFGRKYFQRVALLQSEDIQRVGKHHLLPSRWSVSLLGPAGKEEILRQVPLEMLVQKKGSPVDSTEKEIRPPVFRKVLDNGIRLIVKENRGLPIVSLQVSFLGGVRYEEEALNGINQFMAVMITKGTEKQGAVELAKKVERMAGTLNGFSGLNSFGLTFTFLAQHFHEALSLLSEIILSPSFDPEEMERRRGPILAAIRRQEDDPARTAFRLFRKVLYEKHPYRMDPIGTLSSIRSITQKEMKEYYRKIAVPQNMVFTAVGDVEANQVALAVQKEFGKMESKPFAPPEITGEPPLTGIRKQEVYKEKEQTHFVLGFLGTTLKHRDRYALEVLDAALSGMGGRLFYELRDKESLAYALAFINHTNFDPGHICVYMGTHPGKLDQAVAGVLRELKKVREEGLSDEEVERAKKYLIGNFEIGLQTNSAQASQISADELYGLGYDHYKRYADFIRKVSKEDVDRAAQKYFTLDAYALAVVRPPEEKKP